MFGLFSERMVVLIPKMEAIPSHVSSATTTYVALQSSLPPLPKQMLWPICRLEQEASIIPALMVASWYVETLFAADILSQISPSLTV